ncbi:MAG: phosphonate C-P lyase system protein PhnH [Negativicutes bacterium]|nr:phosphonate C-P lyase system protein PhnH [Negativicutes bacterium]
MAAQIEPAFDKVFDTQKFYRQMLDSMARPGKLCPLPELDLHPPAGLGACAAGIAFTLLDSETSFAVLPDRDDWQEYLRLNTGSAARPVSAAEFIVADGRHDLPQISEMNRGSLLSPEEGSTLILLIDRLTGDAPGVCLTLRGPGVKDSTAMAAQGLAPANLERILRLNEEFPLGVDLFLVDTCGNLAAVPRSSSVDWEVKA